MDIEKMTKKELHGYYIQQIAINEELSKQLDKLKAIIIGLESIRNDYIGEIKKLKDENDGLNHHSMNMMTDEERLKAKYEKLWSILEALERDDETRMYDGLIERIKEMMDEGD